MESRARQFVQIAGVVVMQMRHDDVGDFRGINVEEPQRVHRTAKPFALAPVGGFFGESGVDNERTVAAAQYPHEIVQIRSKLVRVSPE